MHLLIVHVLRNNDLRVDISKYIYLLTIFLRVFLILAQPIVHFSEIQYIFNKQVTIQCEFRVRKLQPTVAKTSVLIKDFRSQEKSWVVAAWV